MVRSFKDILDKALLGGAKRLVVPCPRKEDALLLYEASAAGLIFPCFVGNGEAIKNLVDESPLAEKEYEIVKENDPHLALGKALEILHTHDGGILMQGGIPAHTVLHALHDKSRGMLPKGGIMSFVSVFPLLMGEKLILVTDTYINNHPTVAEKQQILTNALNLARILGIEAPKVAVLAAIEQVNPSIPSTLSAAILSKMSERRQFGDAIVEGPLDIDCALSRTAAERKGVKSTVTGEADVYLVPEVDTGHLMAEALVFFGKMKMLGVVMGTSKPVILDLPFVSLEGRLAQIAMACLLEGGDNPNG
ncbi:MAG TPA: phosphate acyltransferase [Deltaproteobacteria bacterium]|nr:phosphate acyltransferase [Deltaproteobacteria bacterium]